MNIIDIKNMHSDEMRELIEALKTELRFRENIGKDMELSRENNGRYHVAGIIDEQLRSAFRLRETLNEELTRCETMTDRVVVRKDIKEVDKKISDLTRENLVNYVDESSLH
tara:strand:+ start:467 stop:799 length:333 start_codon:yes stop_codon:yes gene_type:complete